MSDSNPNIYDIAKLAGVSIATVSRVVNGSDKVSDRTRKRVLQVIEDEGYTPNVFAQGLGLNTMHTVGILVPDISDLYMSTSVSFLEKELHEKGYEVILSCSGFDLERKRNYAEMLLNKRIDALILVGSTYAGDGRSLTQTDYIRDAARSVPVFVINGLVEGDNVYCTVCDDSKATYDITKALIARGRKRILFLSDSHSYSAQQKLAGYEKALTDCALPVLGDLRLSLPNHDIYYVRDLLLQYRNLSFDAAVAVEDTIAVGVMKYAAIRGLSIPEDLEISGYNNSVVAISCTPELTSVDSRVEELCHQTVTRLLSVLSGDKDIERTVSLSPIVMKRNTTDF